MKSHNTVQRPTRYYSDIRQPQPPSGTYLLSKPLCRSVFFVDKNMDSAKESELSQKAIMYMILLAFQFGFQPILSKQFTPTNISRSSVILIQEFLKFTMALSMLKISGSMKTAVSGKLIHTYRRRDILHEQWKNG